MDPSVFRTPDEVLPQEYHILRGSLASLHSAYPANGLVALGLRAADGSELEVLVDAASLLGQPGAAFGSPPDALGQPVELALDLFGFATLRACTPVPLANAFPSALTPEIA